MKQPKSPDLPPKKSIDANSVLLPNISNFTQHEIEGYFAHHYPNCLVVCKPGSTGKGKPYAFITFKDANVVASLTKQKVLMIGKKQLAVRPAFENKAGEEAKAYVIKYDEEGSQNDAITVEVRRKDGKAMNSSISIDESLEFEVVLTNDSATGNVFLDGTFDSYGCSRLFRVDLKGIAYWQKNARNEEKCCILPKKRHTFSVVFSQPNLSRATYGKFTIYLGLTLCRTGGGTIRKRVAVVACVGDDAAMHLLRPTSAYVEPTQDDLNIVRTIIHAYPPERKSKSHLHTDVETYWVEELEAYDLPERVQLCIDTSDKYSNLNPWDLVDTYRQKMHDLLWMEEATQKKLLRRFDKHNVAITPVLEFQNRGMTEYCHDKSISKIEVSNLAEKRPSVLPGDIIYAWLPHTADYEYEGYVIMVQEDAVLVEFCENFHARFPTGTLFHIRFGFKRQYYRYLHRSVDKVSIDLVFPQKDQSKCEFVPLMDVRSTQQLHHKNFFNTEQLSAITKIVNKSTVPNNIPFVIRGPFGTGKSKVLIEAVYQLVHYRKSSRLLICTPSNTAADAVTEQLAEFLTPDHLFRLYAFHHKKQSVPLAILPYCYYLEDKEVFYVPAKEALMKYTVVVCTAVSAALLYGVGLRGHFSHIIMDEAAQVMEAEALIAMSLADTKACVILSGDEKQIGSVLQSGSVKHHGLANSIIERLIRSPYFTQLGDNAMLTFTKNYRTHSDILRFVSERFYTGQLEAMSKPTLVNWPRMPNRKFPIFFMAVQGEDARESDSPSYFNRYEVVAVVNMVQNLIDNKIATRDEIGIISPFYKQNGKIAMLCRERKLGYIKIGSVAEFQGKEKKILFVSTVRSNPHNLAYDKMYGLGLLKNRRHLNTALTRVTSLLVIVGDPYILQQDEDWAALIKYCKEHGNFAGGENTRDDATGNVSNVTPYAVRDHGRPVSTTVAVSTITSDSKKRREVIPSQVIESSSPPTSILCPTVSKIPSSQSPSLKVPRQFSSDQPIQPSTLPLDTGSSVLNTAREVGASAVPEHGPLQSFLTTPHPHTPQVLPQQSLLTPKCGTAPTPFSEHAEFMPVPQKRHKQQHNLSHGVYPLHSGRDFNHPDTGAGSQPRMRSQTSLLSLDSMSVLTSPRSFPVSPFNQSICDYCVSCQQLGHTSQDCLVQDIFCLVPGLFVVWKNPEAQGLVKRVVISPIVKLEMAVYQRDGGLQVTVCTMGYDVAELNSPKDFFLYLSSKPDHGNLPRKISVTIKVEFDEFPQVEVVESSPHIVSLFFCAQQHL